MRLITLAGLISILLCGGCSSVREVPRSDWSSAVTLAETRVATVEGYEYRFDRAVLEPDTLFGIYDTSVERKGPKGEIYFETVSRRHPIPLGMVVRLEQARRDPVRTAMAGAGLAAAGYFLVTLVDENPRKPGRTGGGGKSGGGGP